MFFQPAYRLGVGIAGRRHVELHAALPDRDHDFGVFLGANAMPESASAHGDRLSHALRTRGLTGMNRDVQAHGASHPERVLMEDGRRPGLIPRPAEADHALTDEAARNLRQ